jgi:predicted transcriptional regulator
MPGLVPGIHVFGMEVANMLSFRRRLQIMNVKLRKIEVDDATATALEARAAAAGVSVSELIAQLVSSVGGSAKVSSEELDDLDRQWAAIKAGEPTVAHDNVVRWLDTWGAPSFRPWRVRR